MDTPESLGPQPAPPGNGKLWKTIAIVLGILFLLGILGSFLLGKLISFGMRKAFEGATGIAVNEKNNTVSIQTKGGTATFTDAGRPSADALPPDASPPAAPVTMPSDFPANFPIPSGMTLASAGSFTVPGNEGQAFMLSWTTTAPASQVIENERSTLAQAGWTLLFSNQTSNGAQLMFERSQPGSTKKDSAAFGTEPRADGGTTVNLELTMGVNP